MPFGTPIFRHFEHKIEVFVRFCPPKPSFSGISSTKSAFLCQKRRYFPGFVPFRAQNRGFCALLPASFFPMAPSASSKPHSAEKRTPVWLAIWRTWAGFANSQLRRATIRAPNNISAHPPCCHIGRCSNRANLSTHQHRLPTPPPYLRRMRLSPGRGEGVGWQMVLLVVRVAVPANHRARESLF